MSSDDVDQLRKLASALGCSLAAFDDEEFAPDHLRETAEMFRLWMEMGPSEDRTQLLTIVRNMASTKRDRIARRYK